MFGANFFRAQNTVAYEISSDNVRSYLYLYELFSVTG